MEYRDLQREAICRACNKPIPRMEKAIYIDKFGTTNKQVIILCRKCVRVMNIMINNDDAYSGKDVPKEDMLGRRCKKCGAGTYQEMSMWDEKDGVLHCNSCNHETDRYRAIEKV